VQSIEAHLVVDDDREVDVARRLDLDETTLRMPDGWRAFQSAEFAAGGVDQDDGWVSTDRDGTGDGDPIYPTLSCPGVRANRASRRRARHPIPRPAPHARSLLIKEGVPVKVVSERLGHADIASLFRPTSTSCPACKPTPPELPSGSPSPLPRPHGTRGNIGGPPEEERLNRRNASATRKARSLTWAFTHSLVAGVVSGWDLNPRPSL
jgi:hypothetical protein